MSNLSLPLQLTSVLIPEGVESIDKDAFWGCSNLKTIVLPSTLKMIGKSAFWDCKRLTSILIPEGVESIDKDTFWGCSNLKTVEFPSSLKRIGESAFKNCERLTKIVIPEGCEIIGAESFFFCERLKDIFVPASVHDIADKAFFTLNDATIIHTAKSSTAEAFAKEHRLRIEYDYGQTATNVENVQQYTFSETQTSLRLEAEARKRLVSTVVLLLSMIQGRKEAEVQKLREEEARKHREEEARQRKEAEERKAEYDDLVRRKAEQEQIVAENQGGFLGLGKKAKLRREAMAIIEGINEKLKLYPEFL